MRSNMGKANVEILAAIRTPVLYRTIPLLKLQRKSPPIYTQVLDRVCERQTLLDLDRCFGQDLQG